MKYDQEINALESEIINRKNEIAKFRKLQRELEGLVHLQTMFKTLATELERYVSVGYICPRFERNDELDRITKSLSEYFYERFSGGSGGTSPGSPMLRKAIKDARKELGYGDIF